MGKKERQRQHRPAPPVSPPADVLLAPALSGLPPAGAPSGLAPAGAPSGTPAATSRRDFLARAGAWTAGACGLAALAGAARFASPESSRGPSVFPLGALGDFKVRTVTWLRDVQVFVVRDERGFGAFSARCTHLGCTVQRTADGFACPCHGARFDSDGRVLSGPARRALPWYRTWLAPDGRLWVDLSAEVPPGQPGRGGPS
jgi:cytochrome b6-f complex iron-sulfur subunit